MNMFMALVALLWALVGSPSADLALGAHGSEVRIVQRALDARGASLAVDGIFGPGTRASLQAFQSAHHLTPDGVVGPETAAALVAEAMPPTLTLGVSESAVLTLQHLLNDHGARLADDGVFGPKTETALKAFQASRGLTPDGIAGPRTWGQLADPVVKVQTGETLSRLAGPLGLTPEAVARQNGVNVNRIEAGSSLVLPVFGPGSRPSASPRTAKASVSKPPSTAPAPKTASATQAPRWGGAGTASLAIAFYGPPDAALLAAVAHLGVPVTVFLTKAPAAPPKGLTLGVDALQGTAWHTTATALAPDGHRLYALTTARRAAEGAVSGDKIVPLVAGAVIEGTNASSLEQALLQNAVGGEVVALPLSGSGLRAASGALSSLRHDGYVLEAVPAVMGP